MDIFLIERLMGLFWVTIQAGAFAAVKYAWLALCEAAPSKERSGGVCRGEPGAARVFAMPMCSMAALAAAAFAGELSPALADSFYTGGVWYWPWAVRIMLCGAMIYYDSMLVLYFARIVRLYRGGRVVSCRVADAAVLVFTAALTAGYIFYSIRASVTAGFSMEQYVWIGRFFIIISNVFYVALEAVGAVMMRRFYIGLCRGESR